MEYMFSKKADIIQEINNQKKKNTRSIPTFSNIFDDIYIDTKSC